MSEPMFPLAKKAFLQTFALFCFMAIPLLVAAGTYEAPRLWRYLAVFFVLTLAVTLYLFRADPALLERRLAGKGGEKEPAQKKLRRFASLSLIALLITCGLDIRFHWSVVPAGAVAGAYAFILAGFFIVFLVLRENTYASSVIEVDQGQKVITTGPYHIVRHPMYVGSLVLFIGTPLALGSWWGLLFVVPLTGILAARSTNEEKFLLENLSGYDAYCRETRYRFVPFIW